MDKKDLFYIFVTALEGGIGYWSVANDYHWQNDGEYDLDGFYALVEETESDEPVEHRIDAQTILRGLEYFARGGEGYKHVRAAARSIIAGDEDIDYDAEIADCIVQAGVFGEVVYG